MCYDQWFSSRAFRIANAFLTEDDITVISASILFFAAFFIALFTQYRAEVTVIRLLARLWTTNRNWQIRDYDEEVPPVFGPALLTALSLGGLSERQERSPDE